MCHALHVLGSKKLTSIFYHHCERSSVIVSRMTIASPLFPYAWDADWHSYYTATYDRPLAVESRYVMGTSSKTGEVVALTIVRYENGTTRQRCIQESHLNVDYQNVKGGRFRDDWMHADLSHIMLQTGDREELEETWHYLSSPELNSPRPSTVDSETEI